MYYSNERTSSSVNIAAISVCAVCENIEEYVEERVERKRKPEHETGEEGAERGEKILLRLSQDEPAAVNTDDEKNIK